MMKNFLIVGGSSGIGRSLCDHLSTEGHRVHATYFQHAIQDPAQNVSYSYFDATTDEPQLGLADLPDELHGIAYCPGSIDLKPFHRLKPASFEEDYRLQVVGAVKVLQAALPRLKAAGNASVVLFSTVAVQTGFNFHAQVAASKGALEGLTRSLAAEWAPRIRVNAIAPSLTDTPLAGRFLSTEEKKESNAQRHPLKRIGSPDEIAQMAAFLMSDAASWMTGQIVAVDGGMSSIR